MGHIRRIRFASILGAGLLAMGGMGVAMAQGGISANMALSNTIFTQQVGSLDGKGMKLFVDKDKMKGGDVGITRLRLDDATITDLCMSAPIKLPGLGDKKFQMVVAGPNTSAQNLVIGAKDLSGSMTLYQPRIGVDAQGLSENAVPGSAGIQAQGLDASGQTIHASSIAADKLTAAGGKISVQEGNGGEC
ncbi:hypothetical protein CHEID_07720 [Corynebacterium heidelbergense]|uniref:Cholesterol esterase n=2 Tax=Corynebacterium heidelbergense TaxID=2055947 RepID=A0A364V9Z4_9CORY|nr:DUF6230 family protein [Corynebacterium heidelbergense]RAV33386.1 hypothetical protein CWC39_08720 [Corynebacterium heidelbergense]WCZ37077.1 hypothetical protein CHEID_07720 [Corynebacterium heidelbergense]